mmetsp:Transcript_14082/g.35980  ORF Transcript_14082/g.35980 Transcript_14082/m.35980 type:complete len:259 (+) Transcript_14082:199-975(+)
MGLRPRRDGQHESGLEHERQGVVPEVCGRELRLGRLLKRGGVRPVRRHAAVQAAAAWEEAFLLRLVHAADQPHVLAHAVAVVVWGAECFLGHHPAGREDDKVGGRHAGLPCLAGQHGEDGRVQVVECHRVHCTEQCQIILIGGVIAMPSNHVERAGHLLALKQGALKFIVHSPRTLLVLVPCHRVEEVAVVGQAVGANRPKVRKCEMPSKYFTNVPPGFTIWKFNFEVHAPLNNTYFSRFDLHRSELCLNIQSSFLRH